MRARRGPFSTAIWRRAVTSRRVASCPSIRRTARWCGRRSPRSVAPPPRFTGPTSRVRRWPSLPERPFLVLMSGLPGSGKTWLADRLAPTLGALHLRSDVERKRLAGLAERSRSHSAPGEGLYSKDASRRAYQYLARAAAEVMAGGYSVIVDATFSRRVDRELFRALASRLEVVACLIHCQAPRETLVTRIADRGQDGRDASEADVAILDWQEEGWEDLEADEPWTVFAVETATVELSELAGRIRTLKA